MGKVVFNIVETDYDVSKDEEKYQKFRKDYLENLSVGVCIWAEGIVGRVKRRNTGDNK